MSVFFHTGYLEYVNSESDRRGRSKHEENSKGGIRNMAERFDHLGLSLLTGNSISIPEFLNVTDIPMKHDNFIIIYVSKSSDSLLITEYIFIKSISLRHLIAI